MAIEHRVVEFDDFCQKKEIFLKVTKEQIYGK